ncbi:MAG TPA: hypothetical protein ENI44_01720, partial [Thermoplasmatales archaeon]|nr:hypothetical protein [Thermoplasmatales archaeon]
MRFLYITIVLLLISPNVYITVSSSNIDPYKYYTYQSMTNLLYSLAENYSNIMMLKSIGKTYEGRDIWMVKLSDNPDVEEDEPGVL